MDDLLAEFLTEANESLAGLDEALLTLERAPDDVATVGLIFRLIHTIKGTCGFLGLPRLERVAHSGENVLGLLRESTISATPELVTAVFSAVDIMKEIVTGLSMTGLEPEGDDTQVINRLDAIFAGEFTSLTETVTVAESSDLLPDPLTGQVRLPIAPLELPVSNKPGSSTAENSPLDAPGSDVSLVAQTIRVSVNVLENLMTLVSELVLTRNQLLQISRTSRESRYATPVQRLSQITSDLQEGVMKTRMQPIGSAWSKLPRLVRDLVQDLGKPIELQMIGAETEIDRQVLELIRDPLTHMVRNSADHGLECPEERRAAGKPAVGIITLNAFHEGGHITIQISDDGRGLAVDRIREKILTKGLATEVQLASMSTVAIERFILHPGFSTAAQVTSVSGRGVGMDVVKTNIEQIGGTIELENRPGRGTTFTIKIPLTLAIVSALIVESAGERFAIAQSSVAELVHAELARPGIEARLGQTLVEEIDGTRILRLRDQLLPLVTLSDLLRLPSTVEAQQGMYVVVVAVGSGSFGIVVDRVFDTEEIVVKPVAPILRDITMFSGNTVLGDGTVIMILDPNGIARAVNIVSTGAARTTSVVTTGGVKSEDETAILLFRAGSKAPKAVPLGLVARLERIPTQKKNRDGWWPIRHSVLRRFNAISVFHH